MEQVLSISILYHLKTLLVILIFFLSLPVVKKQRKRIARLWLKKGKYIEEALLMPNGTFKIEVYSCEYYRKEDIMLFVLKSSILLGISFFLSFILGVSSVIPCVAIINISLLMFLMKREVITQKRKVEDEIAVDFCRPCKR